MSRFEKGILFTNDNCIGCNKCISQCSIIGANISILKDGKRRIHVDANKCNHCGKCIVQCSHNARDYSDDSDRFLDDLKAGKKISLVVSSSFFTLYREKGPNLLGYLKSLGVEKIYDSSFGSEIAVWAHVNYILKHYDDPPEEKAFIAHNCPALVNTIELYHPALLNKLIPVQSPSVCIGIYAKKYLNDTNDFAYLCSCIAKKDEIDSKDSFNIFKYSITYDHLFKKIPEAEDYKKTAIPELRAVGLGRLITTCGGFKEAVSYFLPHGENLQSMEGMGEYNIQALEDYTTKEYSASQPLMVDLHACIHGCIEGPGIEHAKFSPSEIHRRIADIHKDSVFSVAKYEDHEKNLKSLNDLFSKLDINDFHRNFTDRYKQPFKIPEATYNEIFQSMYKNTDTKRSINCGSCGYKTCWQMVTAIAYGYNKKENCINYMNEELERRLNIDPQVELRNKQAYIRDCAELINNNPDIDYLIGSGDINRFKIINDLYGNTTGDAVLKHVANVLKEAIEPQGIVARLTGGQFAFCIAHTVENLERLRSIQSFDCSQEGVSFPVTMRWGLYVTEHIPEEQVIMFMINCANLAMDKTNSPFKNTYTVFTKDLREKLKQETIISTQLKPALENNEFKLWFQPQYSTATGEIAGTETLCRWIKPDGEIITPSVFIPIAEKNGFIRNLDEAIWKMAFQTMRKWLDKGYSPVPLSVNISRISLTSDALIYYIARLKTEYNMPVELIHFEVTESAYMSEQTELVERIQKIRELGFQVAMDDFGSGYSSLNSLKDIPIDILKLDMGFLRSSQNLEKGGCILNSVIKMAQALEFITIAEGVETESQANFLKSLGCDIIQGFLYARPMPEKDYEKLIKTKEKHVLVRKPNILGKISSEHFNDPDSVENLMFEHYSGPSLFIQYDEASKLYSVLKINEKFINLLQKQKLSINKVHRQIEEILNSKSRKDLHDILAKVLESSGEQTITFPIRSKEAKKTIWLKNHVWHLSSIGKIHTLFVLADDITQERTSTDLISLANKQLQLLLDLKSIGMTLVHISFDPAHIFDSVKSEVLYVNDSFCENSGYSREDLYAMDGRQFLEIMHPLDIPKFLTKGWQVIKEDLSKPLIVTYKARHKSGRWDKVKMISVGDKLPDGSYMYITNYFFPDQEDATILGKKL
ncbi:MAG: EAL domain-containing protein [Treponema sp.]|nr:EAL domain-containing protein [Treponema sp.]